MKLHKSRYIDTTFSILSIMLLCNILCTFVWIVTGELIVCLLSQAAVCVCVCVCVGVHVRACARLLGKVFFIAVGYMVD